MVIHLFTCGYNLFYLGRFGNKVFNYFILFFHLHFAIIIFYNLAFYLLIFHVWAMMIKVIINDIRIVINDI
jgi:hypothetical protein